MNYLAMIGPADDPLLDEKLGYYGEKIVLEAQRMGLNTCWVALTFRKNRKAFTVNAGEKLRCVVAIGYGQTQGAGHKIKTVEQVSKCDGPMPDWFRRGVEAALLAPTAINQQKFVIRLNEDDTVDFIDKGGVFSRVDLGIIKCHFEIGAEETE
jgi:nitroreductase